MSFKAHKVQSLGLKAAAGDGTPTDKQLTAVNQYTLKVQGADEVYVRTAYLAHNGIDRDKEAFDDSLLSDFAKTIAGKGLFVRHPGGWDGDSGPGRGRWFGARVVTMSLDEARAALNAPKLTWPPGTAQAKLLEVSYFVPRSSKNADLISDIDAGVASDVSIGFRASQRSDITDGDGNVIARRLHGPGEALEGSLVWLGAQPGARTVKGANQKFDNDPEEAGMDPKDQQIKQLQDQVAGLNTKNADAQKSVGIVAGLRTVFGEAADALLASPEELKAAVDAGNAYVEELLEGLTAAKRHMGLLGDDPAEVEAAKSAYRGMPLKVLKAEHAAAQKKVPDEQIAGGDPNQPGAKKPESADGEEDMTSPLNNPALK